MTSLASRGAVLAAGLGAAAGLALTLLDKPLSALVLTLTVAVGIINARWLERLLELVLQPGRARFSWGAVLLFVTRLALWGGLFAVVFLLRRRIEVWAVAVGIGCLLTGLAAAGMRGAGDGSRQG